MKLRTRSGKLLSFTNKENVLLYIGKLKSISAKNPTKGTKEKLTSLFASEAFSSMFTEGEVSSRRSLRDIFQHKSFKNDNADMAIKNFIAAFNYVIEGREFSISNFYTLYNLLSKDVLNENDKLKDGYMYRHADVFIHSNKMVQEFKGIDHKDIKEALNNLFKYLDSSDDDIYLRAILGHIYFEMIHPFFDYNGRTGRFIPLWLFTNNNISDKMLYFATAIGNYREQYISMFRNNIDPRTYKVNLDRMVIKLTKILILNQYQYIWLKEKEAKYIAKTNKSLSIFQKNFLWLLMRKSEISKSNNSWFKLSNEDKNFIELNWRSATMSVEAKKLIDSGIIKATNDKPRKFQLQNYNLINYDVI